MVGDRRGGQQVGSWVFTLLLLCVLRASALFVVYLLSCTYLVCTCPFALPTRPWLKPFPGARCGQFAEPFFSWWPPAGRKDLRPSIFALRLRLGGLCWLRQVSSQSESK